ncbi:hypothetical protein HMI56_004770 [Coelomomyces lativittatus]|nr:hypothetical protein HMI56_004770 [Coelomomyces lativittatus]
MALPTSDADHLISQTSPEPITLIIDTKLDSNANKSLKKERAPSKSYTLNIPSSSLSQTSISRDSLILSQLIKHINGQDGPDQPSSPVEDESITQMLHIYLKRSKAIQVS